MTRLEVLGREVLAVRALRGPTDHALCMLPAPRKGEVCSLPTGHDGQHEVQVLAFVTIDRFTSGLENPMAEQPAREHAAEQRSQQSKRDEKPRSPRAKPTPRDVRPTRKQDER